MVVTQDAKPRQVLDSAFARKLTAFVHLADSDLSVLSDLFRRRRRFAFGRDMIYQGLPDQPAYILSEGWALSYVLLANGTRQIIDIKIPGDFLGLRSVLLRLSDHNVEPLTDCEASEVLQSDLLDAFNRSGRLGTSFLWAVSRDEAIAVEHIIGLGRRTAPQRVAHFLLELASRLKLVGMGDLKGYDCPLSQYVLADLLGLSAVHVNRVLRELRESGYVTFQGGRVTFHDMRGMIDFCDFDKGYLDHDGPLLK